MKFPHWNQMITVGHRRAVFTWLRVTLKREKLIRYLFHCYMIGRSSGRPVGNPIKTNLQQQRWSWCDSVSSWTWRGAFLRQPNNLEIISCLWKNVGQAITFPFMLLFDTKILAKDCYRANRQPEYRHSVKLFFVIFHVRLELRRINVLVRGLGVSLSLFSQWACSTLVCGGCLRDFSPRQVLGYLYCGIFAICASAFRDF